MSLPPLVYEKAFEMMAQHIESAGLHLEDNFRVSDAGLAFSHAAAAVINSSGTPMKVTGNASLAGLGIDRAGGFWHPLAERFEEPEPGVNGYGFASLLISVASGWADEGVPEIAKESARAVVASSAPTTDFDRLLYLARFSDPALMKLIRLLNDGFESAFNRAFHPDASL